MATIKCLIIFVLALCLTLSLVESIFNGNPFPDYNYTPKIETRIKINRKLRTITCSGVLLTKSLVVTTAKCLRTMNKAQTSVYVLLSDGTITTNTPLQMIQSPIFNISTLENNIGVVVIPQVVGIDNDILLPITLPPRGHLNNLSSDQVLLFGYGRPLSYLPYLNQLNAVELSIINAPTCNIAPMNPNTVKRARPSDICIANTGYAGCSEDEGGGLFEPSLDNSYVYLMAVFSFTAGSGKCEDNNNGVYINVESHYNWLLNFTNLYP